MRAKDSLTRYEDEAEVPKAMKGGTGDVKLVSFIVPYIGLAIGFALRQEPLIIKRTSYHIIQLVLGTLERIEVPKDFG